MKINEQAPGAGRTPLAGPPTSVFGKLLTIAAGVLILTVAFMFSILALAVVVVVGVLIFAYLKWKTRHLPNDLRDLHERMMQRPGGQPGQASGGRVIEGEVISDAEYESGRTDAGRPDQGGQRPPPGRPPTASAS